LNNEKYIMADANIFLAVILGEPTRQRIIEMTHGCLLAAPDVLPFEIANALSSMTRRNILNSKQAMSALTACGNIQCKYLKTDIPAALALACTLRCYAYDAYYLELAKRLNIPLLTMDKTMKNNALELDITIMEV
jgi:predicted nucleic acid-binding protein